MKILSLGIALLVAMISYGQINYEYDWAIANDVFGQYPIHFYDISADQDENLYLLGNFADSVDFDPGIGESYLWANQFGSTYLQKMDSSGIFDTVVQLFGLMPTFVECDQNNDVYISGYFFGTVDFDPGPNDYFLNSNGSSDIFLLKLDANGNFLWAHSFGGSQSGDSGYGIEINSNNDVILTGVFRDTVDFDPGPGVNELIGKQFGSIFLMKLNESGTVQWTIKPGGDGSIGYGNLHPSIGGDNSIYLACQFSGTDDFDPTGNTNLVTSFGNKDIAIQKFSPNGDLNWVKFIQATGNQLFYASTLDSSNNFIVAANAKDSVDIDPGTNVLMHYGPGNIGDDYIVKLNSTGDFVWGKSLESPGIFHVYDMVTGNDNQLFMVMESSTISSDFDPNASFYNPNVVGSFLVSWDSLGNFLWTKNYTSSYSPPEMIRLEQGVQSKAMFLAGRSNANYDYDPGLGVDFQGINSTTSHSSATRLTLCPEITGIDTVVNCGNYILPGTGQVCTTSGDYSDTLSSYTSCDSIVAVNLTIFPEYHFIDTVEACQSFTSISGNNNWTTTGVYTEFYTTVDGCDSNYIYDLTIYQPVFLDVTINSCDFYVSPVSGTTWNSSGIYSDTIFSSIHCDTVYTLDLTINASSTGTDIVAACDSYTWINGTTYTTSNNSAQVSLTNSVGCDSVVTLDLTILNSTSATDVITACDSYTWIDGNTYTTSHSTAQWTLTNAQGCDSIITLNLTINSATANVTSNDPELIANPGATSYQWLDCLNGYAIIPGATSNLFIPTSNGEYAVVIEENGCLDTSTCFVINNVGLSEIVNQNWKLYPNPTNGNVTLKFHDTPWNAMVEVTNPFGQIISQQEINASEMELNLGKESGVYFVRIISEGGDEVVPVVKL